MNRKIIFSLLAASALTIALAGCAPESGKQAATSLSPQAASSQSPLPAESEASLTYYKANGHENHYCFHESKGQRPYCQNSLGRNDKNR